VQLLNGFQACYFSWRPVPFIPNKPALKRLCVNQCKKRAFCKACTYGRICIISVDRDSDLHLFLPVLLVE
jgi:hypothetical protein